MVSPSRLATARYRMESLMTSTVIVRRKAGEVLNSSGKYEASWDTIYEGPARVRFTQADPHATDAAGQRSAEQSPTVSLPISSSADVRVDDIGEVLESPLDPGAVGLIFRVAGVHAQSQSTARRLPVEVTSRA